VNRLRPGAASAPAAQKQYVRIAGCMSLVAFIVTIEGKKGPSMVYGAGYR
jgi:hypothetical protein